MAETAPLTNAHSHAHRAGLQTKQGEWNNAAEEHQQAATAYSSVRKSTSDREALRILRLLEAQHQRIAQIIRSKDDVLSLEPAIEGPAQSSSGKGHPQTTDSTVAGDAVKRSTSAKPKGSIRESSPSLARDIATRRGIPPTVTQLSAAAQLRAGHKGSDVGKRATTGPSPRIPSSVMDSQTLKASAHSASADDGFSAFYSTLTSGTMSKLSSVLAYAGLPLTQQEPEPQPVKSSRRTVKASNDPDVKKIFSKATLNAIEDDHRQRGLQGQAFGPTESFYVVQTAGGSLSYADIAKAQTQVPIIGEADEEAFVDAHEAQPPSPKNSRGKSQRSNFGSARTNEELDLENATLKQTLEHLASRLSNFEAHAQDASMALLAQSMATLNPGVQHVGDQERIKLLERQIEQQAEQREKLEELAKKQEKKIRAYHSKWEEIKKNAREKERTKRDKQAADDDGSPSVA